MPRIALSRIGALWLATLGTCGDAARPPEDFPEPVVLEIARGTTSVEIAETLEARGVIASKWAFLWHRTWNRDAVLMAGEYLFDRPVPAEEAFEMLASGRVRLYPLTVPEGLHRFDIANLVAEAGWASREEFLRLTADPSRVQDWLPRAQNLEGCLFPETYKLAKSSSAEDLLDAMVSRFKIELDAARAASTAQLGDWEALVLASMIEKETEGDGERSLVSSVFHNRLRIGMLLQCDPTVIYGLVLEGRYTGRILRSDLENPHAYNTYVHADLPPGPIANPGRKALRAAFAPEQSEYLYFVARPGGQDGHVFSKSLRSHNRAVQLLRRYERSRRGKRSASR